MNATPDSDRRDPASLQQAAQRAFGAGEYADALALLDAAEQAFMANGDRLSALRTGLGRCNVLIDMGRSAEAITTAQALREDLAAQSEDDLSADQRDLYRWLLAAAAENHGSLLEASGRHTQAVDVLRESLDQYGSVGSDVDRARVRASLGVQLLWIGAPEQAIADLTAACVTFSQAGEDALAYRCIVFESKAHALRGDYAAALDRLSAAAELVGPEAGTAEPAPDMLRGRLAVAEVQLELNMFPEVLAACDSLRPLLESIVMPSELATCRHLEARAHLGLGSPQRAHEVCGRAIALWNEANLDVLAARAGITLARCLPAEEGLPVIDDAITVLEQAGERVSVAEAAVVGATIAGSHMGATSDIEQRYLDLAIASGALDVPEIAWRERWLRSLSVAAVADRAELLDDALTILRRVHAKLDDGVHRAPFMATRRDPLEARLALHLERGETASAYELSAAYRAASLGERGAGPPGQVDSSTLLYQSIGDHLYCFVRTCEPNGAPSSLHVVDLGSVLARVDELAAELNAHWRHAMNPALRLRLGPRTAHVETTLRQLASVIFEPVQALVPDGPIVVVPTGRLATLPFAALHDGSGYVGDRRVVSLAPGVVDRGAEFRPVPERRESMTLAVGVPDELAPAVESEATRIASITQGALLVGPEATAEATRKAAEAASIVHLAGHSTYRSDNPWFSSFRFADRSVTALEFSEWNLEAKTVVLASCSSARQANLGEDELLGLPRALLMAGATDVIVNLWPVDDAVSGELMTRFHEHLATEAPGRALQLAQRSVRASSPHPYFWAPAVHYRNPSRHDARRRR